MVDQVSVVVVARASPLRASLTSLLYSISGIAVVYEVDEGTACLRLMAAQRPALLLLDASLPDDRAWLLLRQIKTAWPATKCVVLADTAKLRRHAEEAGAHWALLKGFPAAKLSTLLEQLLQGEDILQL